MIRTIVKNFVALFTGEVIARVSHFISVIYLARMLGAAGFGAINFVLAIISYFLIVTNLGLNSLGIREISRKRDVVEIAGTVISIRLCLALVFFIIVVLSSLFLGRTQTVYLMIAYAVTLFPYALSLDWVFTGIEKMEYNAYGKTVNALIYLTFIILLIKGSQDILKVAFITIFADAVTAVFYYISYHRRFGPLRLHLDLKSWLALLAVSMQLSVSSAMIIIYTNFGTVALGLMRDERTVGIYGAASKLVLFFFALSTVIVTVVFPVMSRLHRESRERLETFMGYCMKATLLLGLPIGVGGAILGSRIIGLVYGPSYAEAGPLFQIMCWYAAINMTSYIAGYSLVACDKQAAYLKILIIGTLFNALFNLFATPFMGYYAPSIALVLTEAMILLGSLYAIERVAPFSLFTITAKPLIASAVMGGMLWILFRCNILFLIPAAILLYFLVLYMIGGITKNDILKIRKAFV